MSNGKIEEQVENELLKWHEYLVANGCSLLSLRFVAGKIRQLFEKQTYTLNCEQCGGTFQSEDAFPSPQLCPKCSESAERRLLTWGQLVKIGKGVGDPKTTSKQIHEILKGIAEAQLAKDMEWEAKTASIMDAFYHEVMRIAVLSREVTVTQIKDAECQSKDRALQSALNYIMTVTHGKNIEPVAQIREALKKQEGVK